MQQHLVLWGDIGTDRKALLAIYLNEDDKQVIIHAFPKEQVDKTLQDQLFAWKNGASFDFPENDLVWHVDANSESILPREIRVDKPEFIQRAQNSWSKLLMSTRLFKVCKEEVVLHKALVESTREYTQELWKKTQDLWQKYSGYLKEHELTWEQTELLKAEINDIFDILKARKRLSVEKEKEESHKVLSILDKKIEELKANLIYPEEWPKIHEGLRTVQADVKAASIKWEQKKKFFDRINEVYDALRSYKKTQDVTHLKDRIDKLKKILHGIEQTIEKDRESLSAQQEKLAHYTRGKSANTDWGGLLKVIENRIQEKEAKITDIKKTIDQLTKKVAASKKNKEENSSEEVVTQETN